METLDRIMYRVIGAVLGAIIGILIAFIAFIAFVQLCNATSSGMCEAYMPAFPLLCLPLSFIVGGIIGSNAVQPLIKRLERME